MVSFGFAARLTAASAGLTLVAAAVGMPILLRRQAARARVLIGKPHGEDAPHSDRVYKRKRGRPVRLVVFGDSIAAGLGAAEASETLGARIAKGVSRATRRAVELRTLAVVGSESSMLAEQLSRLEPDAGIDVAVIVVGGNDVTHRIPVDTSARHLADAIDDLRARGAIVVVGTCPDLSALRPLPQPLRALGGRASRQLARAQRTAALAAGAIVVDLAEAVGPFFVAEPDSMFSGDRFHPSALGYRRTAAAFVPAVVHALGRAGPAAGASVPT